jgi:hypothetical protein
MHGSCDGGICWTDKLLKKRRFQYAELISRRGRFAQPFAKYSAIRSPETIEVNSLVGHLAKRHRQECRRPTQLEFHRDEPALLSGVNSSSSPLWTHQYRTAETANSSAPGAVVRPKFIFFQIDHQVRLAVWHYSLYHRGKLAGMVMERSDERR